MNFNDVSPGEPWQAEPAARYNQLNALLRGQIEHDPQEKMVFHGTLTIDFINTSTETVNAFSGVSVIGAAGNSEEQLGRFFGNCPVNGVPAVNDDLPWGIALGETAPGEYGKLIMSGIAPAHFTGSGKFVSPVNSGLCAADSGNALVLLLPDMENALPGLVILGGSGPALPQEEYNGLFKLQAVDAVTLKIVNGKTPGVPDCGYTDIPGLGNIANAVLTLDAEKLWYIYLLFFYDAENKRYSARISTEFAGDAVFGELLGTFRAGRVTQVLKTMERLVFGNDWYLS